MKIHTTIFFLLIFSCSCEQSASSKEESSTNNKIETPFHFDTTKNAILNYDSIHHRFNDSVKSATLSGDEIMCIDSLFFLAVTEHNASHGKGSQWNIDLKKNNYYRQLVASINKEGEKSVYVICFCGFLVSDDWRKYVVGIRDGGSCVFYLKINLTRKKHDMVTTNGIA